MKINIAIDGPVGSGKTTLGREFAQRINYQFLDSGLFYRYFAKILSESKRKNNRVLFAKKGNVC